MAQRKSRRIAVKSVGFGRELRDDPMVEIASYGDRPFNWNRDTRGRYNCAPTNVSYRVLGQPGVPCPIEARIPEQNVGPDGAPSLCCTSRQGSASHEESLWFLRTLKAVHQGAGFFPFGIPQNLKRILNWINLPTNVSDVGVINPNAPIVLHSNREKYLDVLKFAMMSESQQALDVRLPNSALLEASYRNVTGTEIVVVESSPLYTDIVRLVNEAGVGSRRCTLAVTTPYARQMVRVDPVHAGILQITNDPVRSRCVDVADIVNHFRHGNTRRWRNQRRALSNAFAVLRLTTNVDAELLSLFQVMKLMDSLTFSHWSQPVSVRLALHVGHELPVGYTGMSFQAGDIHRIGEAMAATQPTSGYLSFGENPGVDEDCSFRYRHGPAFWIEVELTWDIVANTLDFSLMRVN